MSSNGFGLVEQGTCTPIYRSAEGAEIGADVAVSGACGDNFKIFFEESDLPPPASASATAATRSNWIRPAGVAPSSTGLQLVPRETDPIGGSTGSARLRVKSG